MLEDGLERLGHPAIRSLRQPPSSR
jgi:hypothetical protein